MATSKLQILDAIRRTAAANGGVPLGWRKFESETGIKDTVWHGRIWARWSDAVREAGFEPNQLNQAYGAEALLEQYAKLSIQLGRLPTEADILLAKATGTPFPAPKTLTETFGGKARLVAKLRDFCDGRDELKSVVAFCLAYLPPGRGSDVKDGHTEPQIGFVYLIKHGARREYKVGRTNNALRREGEIGVELPEKIEPIHVIKTDDPAGIEAYWHRRFADRRKNGEWFELTQADVLAFKRGTSCNP